MPSSKKRPSPAKAKMMLKDNSAQGKPLTSKQKKFFGAIAGTKKRIVGIPSPQTLISKTGKGLESAGAQIRQNLSQGQQNLKSGAAPSFGSINPLKGTGQAFSKGFSKRKYRAFGADIKDPAKRKLARGMKGYSK